MYLSPFHAMYTAKELSSISGGAARLVPAYASANIEVYPYQIAAAMFALRSPYLKGAVLADEGSLGKTYESLLVISQLYFEGRDRILIVVPTPLLHQWDEIMSSHFSMPYAIIESGKCKIESENPFETDNIILTTYDVASEQAELISRLEWNIVVFEEAHRLAKYYTGENKTAAALKEATGDAFKLLLTATPMQNSIMDLYGLLNFIDEGCLGNADAFYKRYFRKPENYSELTAISSRYCFRTLRSQVESYVNIPSRILVTADYAKTPKELQLAALVEEYLNKPEKLAYPKMEQYDLTLMWNRALSSSSFALCSLADGAYGRIQEPELLAIANAASDILPKDTGKGKALLKALKAAFVGLKKKGANSKAIIFTENRATIGFLQLLLEDNYKVLAFDGSKSSDYSVIQRFRDEADILITTDVAAEGFHLAFCSLVVNFDLPYNVLTLEQRILRCHRQGQENDVVVLNFLTKQNFADVRMLELINKRVLQFDGIMGMSDDVVGNFVEDASEGITAAFAGTRHKKEIAAQWAATLAAHEVNNTRVVDAAENALFTTFTADVAEKITVTPQYIKDRTTEINDKLWALTTWFFTGKVGYTLEEETKTLHVGFQPQKVFTGAALRRREYSIRDKTLSPASAIAKNIIGEIFWKGICERGVVVASGAHEHCQIAYYRIKVAPKGNSWLGTSYSAFVGKTVGGQMLTDAECRTLMELPVVHFTTSGNTYGDRDGLRKAPPHPLDELLPPGEFIRRAATNADEARREEISALHARARQNKSELSRKIESLKNQLRQIENALSRTASITERVEAEKHRATASRDLKKQEQSLFMDGMRIEAEVEAAVQAIVDNADLVAEITRLFIVEIIGGQECE